MGRCRGSIRRRTARRRRSPRPRAPGRWRSTRARSGWPARRADLRLGLTALFAVLALAAAGCGGGGDRTPIRIGVLSDCVGFYGAFNDYVLGAAELPLLERGARRAGRNPSDGVESARVAGKAVELL